MGAETTLGTGFVTFELGFSDGMTSSVAAAGVSQVPREELKLKKFRVMLENQSLYRYDSTVVLVLPYAVTHDSSSR